MTKTELDALITAVGTGEKNTALEIRTILFELSASRIKPGYIIPIYCTAAYVTANFDATGLGKNEEEGFGLCNGLGGRPSVVGKTIIGYGDGFTGIGTTIGANKKKILATNLPEMNLNLKKSTNTSGGSGSNLVCNVNNNAGNEDFKVNGGSPVNDFDVMQLSIILVYIQKL